MRKNQFLAKFLHFINLSYFASHHHSLELFKQQEDLKKMMHLLKFLEFQPINNDLQTVSNIWGPLKIYNWKPCQNN